MSEVNQLRSGVCVINGEKFEFVETPDGCVCYRLHKTLFHAYDTRKPKWSKVSGRLPDGTAITHLNED